MNDSSIQPERAWQMALEQLRLDMSKASFDTWVQHFFVPSKMEYLPWEPRMSTAASGFPVA